MKYSRLSANILAAVFCFLFVYATSSDGQETNTPTDDCLPYVAACWDGLDPDVRSAVLREFLSLPRVDFLARSAMAYVEEEEDFQPTEIMGPVRLTPDGPEQLVAFRGGNTYALDLPNIGASVHPGLYWTSGFGTVWKVLLPDGDEETLWVRQEL